MSPAATRAVALAISRALVGMILCVCVWLSITLCLAGESSGSTAWHVLMSPAERDSRAEQLRHDLNALLPQPAALDDWDATEAAVIEKLSQRGYYAQMGVTPPLRELMIWRKQEQKTYDVELPEGAFPVRLALLEDKRVLQSLHAYLLEHGVKTERDDLSDVSAEALRDAARHVLVEDTRMRERATRVAGAGSILQPAQPRP